MKSRNIPESELQKLIAGYLKRDRASQKRVYVIYAPKMMSLCLRYARNLEEAEEILQDGFLQLYRCINQFKKMDLLKDGFVKS